MYFRMTTISFLVLLLSGCTTPNKVTNSNQDHPIVIKAFQTPIIRGAASPRGKRITLMVEKNSQITLDAIQYENINQPINILKKSNDTIWVDAYFYPNSTINITEDNNIEFVSNSCLLFYHTKKDSGTLSIAEMEVIYDTTKWE